MGLNLPPNCSSAQPHGKYQPSHEATAHRVASSVCVKRVCYLLADIGDTPRRPREPRDSQTQQHEDDEQEIVLDMGVAHSKAGEVHDQCQEDDRQNDPCHCQTHPLSS